MVTYDSVNAPLVVTLTWEEPDNKQDPITGYEILVLTSDGETYIEDTDDCDASLTAIANALQCSIPISTLREAPYSLVYNDLVVAKGRAYNSIGFGHYSEPNIFGARVSTIPSKMDPPRLDNELSTLTSITLEWDELIAGELNGGSPIDSYNLIWDAGTNGISWQNV